MKENLFEAQYDITKKTKLKKFYDKYKFLIFLSISLLIISLASIGFYFESKKNKKILLSDSYIEAKIYVESGEKIKSKEILKTIIFSNEQTYSTLSLFLILRENLINDKKELSDLFDHILKNNKFEKEVENLIIFKKALLQSHYVDEIDLLETVKPIITSGSLWRPHALLLLGDYFVSKKEYVKAKEFYLEVLSLKNINKELYEQSRSKLVLIEND